MTSLDLELLPPYLRRVTGILYLALAVTCLWPWIKLPEFLARPVVPWFALVVSALLMGTASILMISRAWRLLTTSPEPRSHGPIAPPPRSLRFYVLGAIMCAVLGLAAPLLGMSWPFSTFVLLLGVGALGDAHRAVQRANTPS